mmetsp:Transcript_144709/g.403230  ORF Transcript_144709/g.403230 Transcript_144709/m.403230 type:complete len:220 (+) Transcript_144709:750-1409(+)
MRGGKRVRTAPKRSPSLLACATAPTRFQSRPAQVSKTWSRSGTRIRTAPQRSPSLPACTTAPKPSRFQSRSTQTSKTWSRTGIPIRTAPQRPPSLLARSAAWMSSRPRSLPTQATKTRRKRSTRISPAPQRPRSIPVLAKVRLHHRHWSCCQMVRRCSASSGARSRNRRSTAQWTRGSALSMRSGAGMRRRLAKARHARQPSWQTRWSTRGSAHQTRPT